jgi:hypothetical protein
LKFGKGIYDNAVGGFEGNAVIELADVWSRENVVNRRKTRNIYS